MTLFALNLALAGIVAAVAGLVVERLCPRRAVALRHALLLACMAIIAGAPLLACVARITGVGVLRTHPTAQKIAADTITPTVAGHTAVVNAPATPQAAVTEKSASRRSIDFSQLVSAALPYVAIGAIAVWALGTLYRLIQLIRSWTFLRHLSSLAKPVGPDVRRLAAAATRRLGLRHMPEVSWSALAPSPLVTGLIEPRVLLPYSAAALSADELEAVLLHELAHVARCDQWAGLAASMVQALFWWCVPVAVLIRRLGDLREQLCDAQVVARQGNGLCLASALLSVCEWSLRGRPAYAAAALGAAGSSGHALRNRIQSLTNEENRSMNHTNLLSRCLVGAVGLMIAGAVTVMNVRTTEASPAILLTGVLSPTARMLSTPDFWEKVGGASTHDFDKGAVAELRWLAERGQTPEERIRATKLVNDIDGRIHPSKSLTAAQMEAATKVAFEYLESHLADAEVSKYAPERGFTHQTVSVDEGKSVWVLIETPALPPATFNGGLNIHVDLDTSKVTGVKQWGTVRPPEEKIPPKKHD